MQDKNKMTFPIQKKYVCILCHLFDNKDKFFIYLRKINLIKNSNMANKISRINIRKPYDIPVLITNRLYWENFTLCVNEIKVVKNSIQAGIINIPSNAIIFNDI